MSVASDKVVGLEISRKATRLLCHSRTRKHVSQLWRCADASAQLGFMAVSADSVSAAGGLLIGTEEKDITCSASTLDCVLRGCCLHIQSWITNWFCICRFYCPVTIESEDVAQNLPSNLKLLFRITLRNTVLVILQSNYMYLLYCVNISFLPIAI